MISRLVILAMLAAPLLAQGPGNRPPYANQLPGTARIEHSQVPTYADLYCSGYLSREAVSKSNKIVGGTGSPETALFASTELVFVDGAGLQDGTRYSVVRELRDPNRNEQFAGQRSLLGRVGQPYADIAQITVKALRGSVAVAAIDYSCQAITPGDLVIPFQERPRVPGRTAVTFERFPVLSNKATGRVVQAQEFDGLVGTGQKVYLTVGGNEGVKPGDYFRVLRGYRTSDLDKGDRLSYKTPPAEDTQKDPVKYTPGLTKEFPPKAVGEVIILSVTPTSATAMITFALEPVQVGDRVELEE